MIVVHGAAAPRTRHDTEIEGEFGVVLEVSKEHFVGEHVGGGWADAAQAAQSCRRPAFGRRGRRGSRPVAAPRPPRSSRRPATGDDIRVRFLVSDETATPVRPPCAPSNRLRQSHRVGAKSRTPCVINSLDAVQMLAALVDQPRAFARAAAFVLPSRRSAPAPCGTLSARHVRAPSPFATRPPHRRSVLPRRKRRSTRMRAASRTRLSIRWPHRSRCSQKPASPAASQLITRRKSAPSASARACARSAPTIRGRPRPRGEVG